MGADTDFDVLEQLGGDDDDETLDGLLDGNIDDDNTPASDAPNELLDRLRVAGVSEADLKEVDGGILRQADYTQKTQALAGERKQVEQGAQLLDLQQRYAGQPPAAPQSAEDPIDVALKKLDPDGENPQAQAAMRELLTATREAGKADYRAEIAPVLHGQQASQAQALLEREKASFVATFGQKATDRYWPDVIATMTQYAQAGQQVPPAVSVYFNAKPDEAVAVAGQIRKAKQKKQQTKAGAGTLEGFQQVQRTKTPSGGGDRKIPEPTDDETAMRIFARVTQRQRGG